MTAFDHPPTGGFAELVPELTVLDLAASVHFWCAVLGFEIAYQRAENGFVYLPKSAPWLDEYIRELTSFPGSKYADQVDSTTQALSFLRTTTDDVAVFAEFERDILRERVKAGIAHARGQGKRHGRPATASLKNKEVEKLKKKGNHNQRQR